MDRGFINRDFIRQLNDRADIVDLIGRHVQLKKAGSHYKGLCPFHNEKTPSFNVHPQKNFFHCFGCGESGDALAFLMKRESLDFNDAVHRLATITGMEVVYDKANNQPRNSYDREFSILRQARDWYHQCLISPGGAVARNYLKQRGIDDKVIAEYGLGYAPIAKDWLVKQLKDTPDKEAALKVGLIRQDERQQFYDFFRGRLLFPIMDLRGRVLGFGGRVLDNSEPKYINSADSPIFHKGKEFYAIAQALQAKNKTKHLLVVEGYIDVLALAGIDSALACLGTAFTEEHARRLLKWTDKLILAFDGDQAGRKAAGRAIRHCLPFISDNKDLSLLFLPDGEDPHSLIQSGGAAAWQSLSPMSLSEFLLRNLQEADGIEATTQGVNVLAENLGLLPEGNFRQLIKNKAEKLVGINIPIVRPPKPVARPPISSSSSPRPARPSASNETVSLLEKFLWQLVMQPQFAAQLESTWRDLLATNPQGDLELMYRFLLAAEKGSNYLYGYIEGYGIHLPRHEIPIQPSLLLLKECIYRLAYQSMKDDLGQAIKKEDRQAADQAKETLAQLTGLWQQEARMQH